MIEGHGDDSYRYENIGLNFSSNVYDGFSHEKLFEYLSSNLSDISCYPMPQPLDVEREIARRLNVADNQVCVTNGATEAIYCIAQAFSGSESAVLQPTFSEYKDACTLNSHKVTDIYDVSSVGAGSGIVWICNPNNPTGAVIPKNDILSIVEKHHDKLFVFDHSYACFTTMPMLQASEAADMPNVLLLHSMTKRFAVPGLRIGYISGNSNLLDRVRTAKMPWSVNAMACRAASFLLQHEDDIYKIDLNNLLSEKKRMEERLTDVAGVEVWPSDCHILLCRLRYGKSGPLKEWLAREKGILIRDASNFPALNDSFFRIAVKNSEQDDLLVNAISEWLMM